MANQDVARVSWHVRQLSCSVPGSLWFGQRQKLADFCSPRITLAHADLSGFSLFEEAQYRGVVAAERVLAWQSGAGSTPA